MQSDVDADVVAFVRNYDKLNRVLYDQDLASEGMIQRQERGPRLCVLVGDLVWSETCASA